MVCPCIYVILYRVGIGNVLTDLSILTERGNAQLDTDVCPVLYSVCLMVGELGSAFKNSGSGVNSWIYETQDRRSPIMQDGRTGHVTSLTLPAREAAGLKR